MDTIARSRREKKEAPRRGNKQTDDHAIFITDVVNRIAREHGDQIISQRACEIGSTKGQRHEHGLKIIKMKSIFKARDENIIPYRHEPPDKKQYGHYGKGAAVGASSRQFGRADACAA